MTPQEKLAAIGKTTERPWWFWFKPQETAIEGPSFGRVVGPAWIERKEGAGYANEADVRVMALAPALRRFAERVLAEHAKVDILGFPSRGDSREFCEACAKPWPCPTVQAAQEELGE